MQAERDTVYKGKIYVKGDELPDDYDAAFADAQAEKAAGTYRPEDRAGASGTGEPLTDENAPVNSDGTVNALDAAGNPVPTTPRVGSRTRSELEAMSKADLVKEAQTAGLTVERSDGGDGEPTKADYVDALAGGR